MYHVRVTFDLSQGHVIKNQPMAVPVNEMSHVQEKSKPVDKNSTPEIKTSNTGEGMFTASLLLEK